MWFCVTKGKCRSSWIWLILILFSFVCFYWECCPHAKPTTVYRQHLYCSDSEVQTEKCHTQNVTHHLFRGYLHHTFNLVLEILKGFGPLGKKKNDFSRDKRRMERMESLGSQCFHMGVHVPHGGHYYHMECFLRNLSGRNQTSKWNQSSWDLSWSLVCLSAMEGASVHLFCHLRV